MGLFDSFRRPRRREDEDEVVEEIDDQDEELDDELDDDELEDEDPEAAAEREEEELLRKSAPIDRREKGPYDASEVEEASRRIDLGALKVPVRQGMQVRLDVEESTKRIMSATIVHAKSTLQVQLFATPRSEGLWNSVRRQLSTTISSQGGEVRELHTEIGRELLAKVPAKAKDGRAGFRLVRFAGVDGPRWFLRGVFGGRALNDDEARAELVEIYRGIVVDRGDDPRPPRDLITLTPPKKPEEEVEAQAPGDDLDPFERGPEITEIR